MFHTAHYLHYVLDTAPGGHCTGDMMRLSTDGYLWHRLKERHGFDGVAFIKSENRKLRMKVYDTESEQLFRQEKKGLFSGQKEVTPQIQPEQFSLTEQKKSEKELLRWLLDRQKKAKNKKSAIVCTMDALELLYGYADEKDRNLLTEEIGKKNTQGIFVVQLPTEAEQLQKALGPMGLLAGLDAGVARLQNGKARRPMLSLLEEQLPERFTDLGNSDTAIENMLLLDALENGDGEDSLEQIGAQARYLTLCCQYRIKTDLIPDEPMTAELVARMLGDPGFRNRLRQEVEQLLQAEEEPALEQLFLKKYHAQLEGKGDMRICYRDDMVSRVAALPALQDNESIVWSLKKVPQNLQTALQTLWNLPRSQRVCDMIETCCGTIHIAHAEQDWDTVTDALLLLQLCTRYLCAAPAVEGNLKELFHSAEEVLTLSAECFRLSRDQKQFSQIHRSHGEDSLSRLQDKIYDGEKTLNQNIYYLKVRRADLHDKLVFFNARERDPQEISNFLSQKLQQLEKKKSQEQQVQTAIDHTAQALPVKPVLWEEEELPAQRKSVDWKALVGPRPWEVEPVTGDSLPEEEEDPFDFG